MIRKIFTVWFIILALSSVSYAEDISKLKKRKPILAILPFKNTNQVATDNDHGGGVSAIIDTHLRNETNFIVIESSSLTSVLNKKDILENGISDAKRMQLKNEFSAEILLAGEVGYIDGIYHIDVRLISTETGNAVVSDYVEVKKNDDLRQNIISLVRKIELRYLRQWMSSLKIVCTPVAGEVYLDDNFIGKSTVKEPLLISKLLEGQYNLRVIAGGYIEYNQNINIKAKSDQEINVGLKSLPGSVNLSSDPSGASIFINEKEVGKTPFTIKDLDKGSYYVQFKLENFLDFKKKITVVPGQETDVKAVMEVIPGKALINSVPNGAVVYFNGKKAGKTPLLIEHIRPKSYRIDIKLNKHKPFQKIIDVKAGKTYKLESTLEKLMGKLTVIPEDDSASYVLFNKNLAVVSKGNLPFHKTPLTIGEYSILVTKPNYKDYNENFVISKDKETTLRPQLTQKPGIVKIANAPNNYSNEDLYIDGKYYSKSTSDPIYVSKGTHIISRENALHIVHDTVSLQPDEVKTILPISHKKTAHRWAIPIAILSSLLLLFKVGEK